ncbi:MAG: septum formation initiator family protein [Nitrospirae bacterium]|nr:septum formation initiator family protein [Nitrospirota bacterium]
MLNVRKRQVDQSRMVRKLVILTLLILAFIYITVTIVFGEKGLLRYLKLKSDKEKISYENAKILQQNRDIEGEVGEMKENPDIMEQKARDQGLTKDGELIFKFEDKR